MFIRDHWMTGLKNNSNQGHFEENEIKGFGGKKTRKLHHSTFKV